jgi:hypothetical protein
VAISYSQLNTQLFWEPRYIAAARTRIIRNTSRDRHSLLCDVTAYHRKHHVIPTHCCVTSPRMRCIATVHAWTKRKHFHRIVARRVCWNMLTEPLPSNALRKSVTILRKYSCRTNTVRSSKIVIGHGASSPEFQRDKCIVISHLAKYFYYTVAYLLEARTVEPLLGNARMQQ